MAAHTVTEMTESQSVIQDRWQQLSVALAIDVNGWRSHYYRVLHLFVTALKHSFSISLWENRRQCVSPQFCLSLSVV